MAGSTLLKIFPNPSDRDIDAVMAGSVCRCMTHYVDPQGISWQRPRCEEEPMNSGLSPHGFRAPLRASRRGFLITMIGAGVMLGYARVRLGRRRVSGESDSDSPPLLNRTKCWFSNRWTKLSVKSLSFRQKLCGGPAGPTIPSMTPAPIIVIRKATARCVVRARSMRDKPLFMVSSHRFALPANCLADSNVGHAAANTAAITASMSRSLDWEILQQRGCLP